MMHAMSGFSEILYRSSPAYTQAYQDGYEQAKKEMQDMLNAMQALYGATSTVSGNKSEELRGG